ncbi:MAG: hypothetical protein ABI318_19195 [Chthoniobacteraceae bacterium]
MIIEEGLSYAGYTHTVDPDARPIIIQPDGDLTINYLDTHGLPRRTRPAVGHRVDAPLRGPANERPQMPFGLHVRNNNRDRTPPLVNLKAVCGPRDIGDPQPAITVMLADEG